MDFGDLSQWRLTMRTVSRSFRNILLRELPGLGTDERYWMFLEYLIFTRFRDKDTNAPCVPSDLVKQIGGTKTAVQFLKEFSKKVVAIEYTEHWSYSTKQCRTVTHIHWPHEASRAIIAEGRRTWRRDDRVYLRTGNKVTTKSQSQSRAKLEQTAAGFAKDAEGAQKRILDYMNARPSNQFMSIAKRNRDKAHEAADTLEAEYERHTTHLLIDNILDQPKPFYRPSGNGKTDRIFGIGESFLTLPSAVRHVLLGGWYEFDLKSAQFAIAAMLWNIEIINAFLAAGGDVWPELLNHFNGYVDKDLIKTLVYTVINGGSKRFVKQLSDIHLGQGAGDHFFAHPFIHFLWRAKRSGVSQIVRNRGARDAFGNWIKLEWEERRRGFDDDLRPIVRKIPMAGSVIAQQAQSYELLLLLPVYDLAEITDEFTVMLHQHDGLTIAVHDKRRADKWIGKITTAVQAQADRLGIRTRLVLA